MKKKLYICPSVFVFNLGPEAHCLNATSDVTGYNLQGDDEEYARTESDWGSSAGGSVLDEENLW